MPATAGRNDPCPCGSGKKYKKCCERVVAIQSAEQAREERERKIKSRLVTELNDWFERVCTREIDEEWSIRFKEFLHLPVDKPIPSSFAYTYRFWLLFDAPCYCGQRPVDFWRKRVRKRSSDVERLMDELSGVHLGCYEVTDIQGDEIRLRSLTEDREFPVKLSEPIQKGMLMIARLSRLVNGYELFGPYTSFGVEMRGEILMYLKNQVQKEGNLKREYWQQNGLQVLGWLMERAREREQAEKLTEETGPEMLSESEPASPGEEETPVIAAGTGLFRIPRVPEEEAVLPEVVGQQLNLFLEKHVARFQTKTRELYRESLALLKEYIAGYFGKGFTWSLLNERVLSHYFGVWYVDSGKGGPVKSRIFLNTSKELFRWIREEAICDIYPDFVPVYKECIRMLPLSFEAARWFRENESSMESESPTVEGTFKLAVSAAGVSLEAGGQWVPLQVNVRGLPPAWTDSRFWVNGTFSVTLRGARLIGVEAVYPSLEIMEEQPV
ncbi:SEC-C motif-containing protein [Melghirimyces profundicolus]|uniref:SEC-C motif-containing protein n=1 Tax=Melghirimyces profundicolus TaxID=1242148 RepID=A0A2T6C9R4_9BACL|nr:SEC-C domain-containing protein [Melghirimyces profundicolus]PTX65040.1 SEC-C motif-containing protein [Melghirimyces profundicolus]